MENKAITRAVSWSTISPKYIKSLGNDFNCSEQPSGVKTAKKKKSFQLYVLFSSNLAVTFWKIVQSTMILLIHRLIWCIHYLVNFCFELEEFLLFLIYWPQLKGILILKVCIFSITSLFHENCNLPRVC